MRLLPVLRMLLISVFLLLTIGIFASTTYGALPESAEKVNETLAGLSDEQVRQMLITELKKDIEAEKSDPLGQQIQGPGAPFERLLGSLDSESAESSDRFKALWQNIPNLFPDIYKVFVSL